MATTGESSSSTPKPTDDKPVIVRVKRKASQSRLDAFWLEINERPLKRQLVDFEKLSLSESSGKEELKAKKVFVRHVETVTTSAATVDIVQSFVPNSADVHYSKTKAEERSHSFKKENIHELNLSRARQQQEVLAKTARFEQIWRRRKGNKEEHDKAVHEMCHFYDVVRLDDEERSNEVLKQEDLSLEDSRLLSSYLPMLREFLPSAAAEIESDLHAYMSTQDDYLYDYYTVKDDMNVDDEDASNPFPRVQVDDEDFHDGPDESDYDSEDSNAEDNPRNDYPDEISEGEEEEEEEKEDGESKATGESEEESEGGSCNASRDLHLDHEDEFFYDDFDEDGLHCDSFGSEENGEDGDDEDWRWSYR